MWGNIANQPAILFQSHQSNKQQIITRVVLIYFMMYDRGGGFIR